MSFLRKLFGPPNVKVLIDQKDVAGLIKALGYKKDAQVRKEAAAGLGKLRDPAAVEALIGKWDDDDRAVQRAAASAVKSIGKPAEEAVRKRLQDPNGTVRGWAVTVLQGITRLQSAARTEARRPKPTVHTPAAKRRTAPRAQPRPANRPAVDALIAKLGEGSYSRRLAAVKEVVKMGNTAIPRLVALLEDEDPKLVDGAIQALEGIGDPRAVKPLIETLASKRDEDNLKWGMARMHASEALEHMGSKAVEPLVSLLEHRDPGVRREAAYVLGNIGDAAASAPLQKLLRDQDPEVREKAILALAEIGGSDAIDPLVAVLESDDEVRSSAARALGRVGDARAIDPLLVALGDSDSRVRSAAAGSLPALGDARAADPLIHALKDEDADVRSAAAFALGQIGDARAVQPLIDVLARGSVVRVALRALGQLADGRAVPAIVPYLEDKDEYVRADAASALGKLGDTRAAEPLVAALKKQTWPKEQMGTWSAYERIAQALGQIGEPCAREVLEDVFTRHRSDERAVGLRAAAAKALVRVAGREARQRLSALASDRLERDLVRKAAEEALKEIDRLPEPAPEMAAGPVEPAGFAAMVSETLDALDAILDPPVGPHVTTEQEQAYVRNVRVMGEGEGTVGFWIREPSDAETRLRTFLALSLVPPPASYRVAQNHATDRGGHFLMFDEARAPGEPNDEYQAAMEANRYLAEGNLAAQRGDFHEALRHFQQAAKGQPYSPEAWNNAAVALASLNRNAEAIRCCDQAIELKPGFADAWDIKGRCLGRLGRYQEAIPVIERYIELAPDDSVHGPRVRQAKRAVQSLRTRLGG